MNTAMTTVPSFTINKKEFFTLWVKQYLLSLQTHILKQKFLENRLILQSTNFTTKIEVNFDEADDLTLQFLIHNNITTVQKLQ